MISVKTLANLDLVVILPFLELQRAVWARWKALNELQLLHLKYSSFLLYNIPQSGPEISGGIIKPMFL